MWEFDRTAFPNRQRFARLCLFLRLLFNLAAFFYHFLKTVLADRITAISAEPLWSAKSEACGTDSWSIASCSLNCVEDWWRKNGKNPKSKEIQFERICCSRFVHVRRFCSFWIYIWCAVRKRNVAVAAGVKVVIGEPAAFLPIIWTLFTDFMHMKIRPRCCFVWFIVIVVAVLQIESKFG